MARPLRLEVNGGLYHISSYGKAGNALFKDDDDRHCFLQTLGEVCQRMGWRCHAYALLDQQYQLLIETPKANLCKGMRQLNGSVTQHFNQRHQRNGTLFQGRYKAIIAEKKPYLLRLNHHIVRAPLQTGLCRSALTWRWSSYQTTVGNIKAPPWLELSNTLDYFGKQDHKNRAAYRSYIRAEQDHSSLWDELQQQIYLGSPTFIKRLEKKMAQHQAAPQHSSLTPATSKNFSGLAAYQKRYKNRNRAIAIAYLSGKYTLQTVGEFFGLHYTTISRIVKQYEQDH